MPVPWPINQRLVRFVYERGEGRRKHRWKWDRAGFVPSKRGPVGKCHRSVTDRTAEMLLHTGIIAPPVFDEVADDAAPDEIYNVYRGVPYIAVHTRPGTSYHGYPWRGRMAATVREELWRRAEAEGTLRTFEKWLKKYSEG